MKWNYYPILALPLLTLVLYKGRNSLTSRRSEQMKRTSSGPPGGIWVKHPSHGDRSGAILPTVITAHALAYSEGIKFNGLCHNNHMDEVRGCLEAVGLEDVIKFSCPPDYNFSMGFDHPNIIGRPKRDPYLTPEWLSYIKSQAKPMIRNSTSFKVAVHVRRGDVSPCSKRYLNRYLPNSYYLDQIQRHVPKGVTPEVTIFSETQTVESFDVFKDLGYSLALGTDMTDVWKQFATSDVFIMSRSTFSVVAGIFNEGKVILPTKSNEAEYWQRRLPQFVGQDWNDADVEALEKYKEELRDSLCKELVFRTRQRRRRRLQALADSF